MLSASSLIQVQTFYYQNNEKNELRVGILHIIPNLNST